MSYQEKIKILESLYQESPELDLILGKLIDISIQNLKDKILELEKSLQDYELKYKLKSEDFYHQFESGRLGDSTDFLEWSGLCELHQKAQRKILSIGLAA